MFTFHSSRKVTGASVALYAIAGIWTSIGTQLSLNSYHTSYIMSPQSTLCERASFSCDSNIFDRFAYVSELVQATDESFYMYRRIDSQQDCPPLESCNNPFQTKKRKVSIYSSSSHFDETKFQYNADFLSAIFQDVADIIAAKENHIDPCLSQTASSKKHKVSVASSLSRCSKSYTCLHRSSLSLEDHGRTSITEVCSVGLESSADVPEEESLASTNLPATISENSCSAVNLTQQATQVPETLSTNFICGLASQNKDSYGWFVEIDDATEEYSKVERIPSVPKDKTMNDLSFAACTAPKKNPSNDAAVEWAKAADTVDNVLGDLPF